MTELVLALPLLVTVLALTLLVGWWTARRQRVVVASRHTVWRHLAGEPTGEAAPVGSRLAERINQLHLRGKALDVQQDAGDGPIDAVKTWADTADEFDVGTGELADALLLRRWPHGRRMRLQVRFGPPLAIGRQVGNEMAFHHGRDGVEWARGQAAPWPTLRQLYYADLDADLSGVGADSEGLAGAIRGLYDANW